MKYIAIKAFSLAFPLLALTSLLWAQSSVKPIEWETLRPEGEDFSVQMPKGSSAQSGKEPYHKFELNTSTYVSQLPGQPIFAVVSMSGIKSNPAMYSEMERLNSYVDAFKNLFPPKIRPKGAVAKLTLVGDKTLQGNPGREYRLTVRSSAPANTTVSEPELSGTAQVFATRKRFYAVVFLNNKKDDEVQEQFLSSFLIPEKTAPVATAEVQGQPEPQVQKAKPETPDAAAGDAPTPDAPAAGNAATSGEASDAPNAKKRHPISGGVLNGKALYLPQPEYPAAAKAAGAAGTVVVRVTIDEQGGVIAATAVSGPPTLQQVSVTAAMQARFSPTLLVGEPVQVVGVLTYNFVR
ncbi:MAG TPA: TonB family protein [Pyrinomonadaceae bacterium]|jgi:protein TonB|nr:TonB family protein [Pyrinomonadaceae bacterium]